MSKIISLQVVRKIREEQKSSYESQISNMSRLDLLQEMIQFQEERTQKGLLTPEMMVRGQALFEALEKHAETEDLRELAGTYRRHLKLEYEAHLQTQKSQ